MKNNKGFTTVELIISFTLTMVIMGFLFEIILTLKDLYISTGVKTELLTKQTIMSRKINDEFHDKKIVDIVNCGEECLTFTFDDGTSSELKLDRTNKIFKYGDYVTRLVEDSEFGVASVTSETILSVADDRHNTIIQISIPIKYKTYKDEDFGVSAIYQYDSRIVSIPDFSFHV